MRTLLTVDLSAIQSNACMISRHLSSGALCGVVKADAYGLGATLIGKKVLAGGGKWLAVDSAAEAAQLIAGGIRCPILLLTEILPGEESILGCSFVRPTICSREGLERLRNLNLQSGRIPIHLKIDTGMSRLGEREADSIEVIFRMIANDPRFRLEAIWSHFASAGTDSELTLMQANRFREVVERLGDPCRMLHIGNSAATLLYPSLHMSLVRCGILLYGVMNGTMNGAAVPFAPAIKLTSVVTFVRSVGPQDRVSYSPVSTIGRQTRLATVAIGYAHGIPRSLTDRLEVLIRGRRFRSIGLITMNQLMVEVSGESVYAGDEVVLVGCQGGLEVSISELAARANTVPHELLVSLGRCEKEYVEA